LSGIISRKSIRPVNSNGRTWHLVLSVSMPMALVLLIAFGAMSPLSARRMAGNGTSCGYNLHNLKSGIEMYANDNGGSYPPYLSYITPNHLNTIPTCPSVGIDTYSCGYTQGNGEFSVCCVGRNHPELMENMPAYNSRTGRLITATNPAFKGPEEEKNTDTATSLILLGILSIVSYLTYRKK